MGTVTTYYDNAELSLAAYGDFYDGMSGAAYEAALRQDGDGMSQSQAEAFAANWRVIDQRNDPSNGLSATVFESVATGERYLAVRGTDGPLDVWTDFIDISVLGTPERQDQYAVLKEQVYLWLSNGTLTPGFTVSGHSLGGFLAGALLVDFPTEISHAYLYNAPGVGGLSAGLRFLAGLETAPTLNLSKVSNLIAEAGPSLVAGLGLDWGAPIAVTIEDQSPLIYDNHSIRHLTDTLAVQSLFGALSSTADMGSLNEILDASANQMDMTLESVVNALGELFQAGTEITGTENDVRDALYARIQAIQSSARYQAAELMADNLSVTSLAGLANGAIAAQAATDMAYRHALLNLSPFVITGNDSIYTPHNTNGELNFENFSDQYLQDRSSMLSLLLYRNTQDIDTNYVPGDQHVNSRAYYDETSGTFFYSGLIPPDAGSTTPGSVPGHTEKRFFGNNSANAFAGGDKNDRFYGMGGNDTQTGNAGDDYLEGGSGNDILTGGQDNDDLSGGAGADTYRFNPGDGLDHIIDAVNDNNDTILINADSSPINLSSYQFHILDGVAGGFGLYQAEHTDSNAPQVTAFFNGSGLMIDINGGSAAGGNTIVVDQFADGNFGIVLGEPEAVEAPDVEPGSYTVTAVDINRVGLSLSEFVDATYALRAARNEQAGVNSAPILLDAESVTWTNATSYAEAASPSFVGAAGIYFDGGNANDQLVGGDRADEYDGWSGDDYIELRGGDDLASGGQGSDTILGGDGDDILYGFYNPYWLEEDGSVNRVIDFNPGDVIGNFAQQPADSDTLLGQGGNDLLVGGLYNDTLDGGADNDLLFGDAGNDILIGGSGDDVIHGDSTREYDYSALEVNLRIIENTDAGFSYNDTIDGGDGDDFLVGEAGDDLIHGGNGQNVIYGDRNNDPAFFSSTYGDTAYVALAASAHGNDRLFGGEEVDRIYGNGGDDYIDGGAGADFLYGDDAFLATTHHGNDTLIGGAGNDYMEGGAGDDIYEVSADSGMDTIVDNQGNNILLVKGLALNNLLVQYQGNLVSVNYRDSDSALWSGVSLSSADFSGMQLALGSQDNVIPLYQVDRIYRDGGGNILAIVPGSPNAAPDPAYPEQEEPFTVTVDGNGHITVNVGEQVTAGNINHNGGGLAAGFGGSGGFVSLSATGGVTSGNSLGSWGPVLIPSSLFNGGGGPVSFSYGGFNGAFFAWGNSGGTGGAAGGSAGEGSGGSDRQIPRDPLVLDLDGDGVELTSLEGSNAYFDLNGDGFATHTSWLDGDDGFLAWDRNTDGRINNIGELFGSPERTGYEELTGLDSNADGVINASDQHFVDLKIWQDANGDGVTQSGELRSLTNVGITSISLSYQDVAGQAGADAQVARQGTFTWQDGSQGVAAETTGIAADVLFASNPIFSRYVGDVTLDPAVLALANIKGYGQMPDLHQAMSLDSDLKDYALNLFNTPSVESLLTGFENLLIKWAGVEDIAIDDIDPAHRLDVNAETGMVDFSLAGESFTLGQLGVIKQYTGMDVLRLGDGQWRENGQLVTTGGYYRQAYNELSRNLLVKLAVANGLLADIAPGLTYDPVADQLITNTSIDAQVFEERLDNLATVLDDGEAIARQWLVLAALVEIDTSARPDLSDTLGQFISSVDDIEALLPAFENPVFGYLDIVSSIGSAGVDTIYGGEAEDVIVGFGGNDHLYGRAGDDALYGNDGNDFLYGEAGNDSLNGGDGQDYLYGGAGDDILLGGAGANDYLSGDAGNDTYLFSVGDGNTTISNYDVGVDRHDVLQLQSGIEVSDVRATRSSNNLLLTVQSTGEVITVSNYFSGDGTGGYALNAIEFADGTVWDIDTVKSLVQQGSAGVDTLYGYAGTDYLGGLGGNDTLYGAAGNDVLFGGAGNDTLQGQDGDDVLLGDAGDDSLSGGNGNDYLYGGAGRDYLYGGAGDDTLLGGAGANDYLSGDAGNDTYLFGVGDGADTVYNYDTDAASVDVARFEDVSIEDLWFSRNGNNLQITVAGTDDRATVSNWYSNANYQLDRIEAGSSVLLNSQVDQLVSAMAAYSVPSGAGNVIAQEVRDELQLVLASTWQAA